MNIKILPDIATQTNLTTVSHNLEEQTEKIKTEIQELDAKIEKVQNTSSAQYSDLIYKFYEVQEKLKYIKRFLISISVINLNLIIYLLIRG